MKDARRWIALSVLLVACDHAKHPREFVGHWRDVTTLDVAVTDAGVLTTPHTPQDFELSADGTGTDPLDGDPANWEVRVDTANVAHLCSTPRGAVGGGRYCHVVFLRGDSLAFTDTHYVRRR